MPLSPTMCWLCALTKVCFDGILTWEALIPFYSGWSLWWPLASVEQVEAQWAGPKEQVDPESAQ